MKAVAISEIYKPNVDKALQISPGVKVYHDFRDLLADSIAALPFRLKREGDVFTGGQVRIEREELKDKSDLLVAQPGE